MKHRILTDTATDEDKLMQKITEIFGEGAAISEIATGSGGYDIMGSDVRGIFVATKSGRGAVRTVGEREQDNINVETKPGQKTAEYYIIVVEEGQSCAVLGKPSYRLIR